MYMASSTLDATLSLISSSAWVRVRGRVRVGVGVKVRVWGLRLG